MSYSWGLRLESNNMVEALALWKGLSDIVVIGASGLVIQALITSSPPKDLKIRQLIKKIQSLFSSFQKIETFHVLRKNNKLADLAANQDSSLDKGVLPLNDNKTRCLIP